MSDYENSLDSVHYINWGHKPLRKLPETITSPRSCHCGYPLRPGEVASYFMGKWCCPSCAKDADERIGWGREAKR